jgi:thioredoxin 2
MIVECTNCGRMNRVPARRLGDRATCGHCKQPLSIAGHPIAIRSSEDFDELVKESRTPVLVEVPRMIAQ